MILVMNIYYWNSYKDFHFNKYINTVVDIYIYEIVLKFALVRKI